jgi:hypothetical protein
VRLKRTGAGAADGGGCAAHAGRPLRCASGAARASDVALLGHRWHSSGVAALGHRFAPAAWRL